MDLLSCNIKKAYFKYLAAAFGSSLISSIYGIVDMAMVGQYHGPVGTAALAVMAPIWNIIFSLGILAGIGGSVLYSAEKGEGHKNHNQFFTASFICMVILAAASWLGIAAFMDPLLILFGADDVLLPLAREYMHYLKFVIPSYMFVQMLSAFLRNDNAPGLATASVLAGGIFNIFGDYFFVFTLDMGIRGAGLATSIGSVISLAVLLIHFLTKKNTLKFVKLTGFCKKSGQILKTGFSTFFIDIAMGILTMLFNRQIMHLLGTDALAVYGVIVNISTFVQCCAYSVGQAAQPILSINYGAGNTKRIGQTLRYALYAAAFFSIVWTVVIFLFPNGFIRIFMDPTSAVLSIAPPILRTYGISFLLLPLNIFSTYYFQSVMRSGTSFIVSVGRGAVISGMLILLLPVMFGADSIWYAMPVTEAATAVFVVLMMKKSTKKSLTLR